MPTPLLDALVKSVHRQVPAAYVPPEMVVSLVAEVKRLPFYLSILKDSEESALRVVKMYGPIDELTVDMCDLHRLNRWSGPVAGWLRVLEFRYSIPKLIAVNIADHLYNFKVTVLNLDTHKVAFDPALAKIIEAVDLETNDAQTVFGNE